jgi:hypothetical protein
MKIAILTLGILSLLAPLCAPAASTMGSAVGFASVFNGLNLDGWEMQGHASWKAERGEIVGRPDPGQKTDCWLFSKEEWTDFTLEVEFKVPEKCNSGIAIRMPKEATGDPDAYGYEVQISDAPGRKPTGSLLHHVDSEGNIMSIDQTNGIVCRSPAREIALWFVLTGNWWWIVKQAAPNEEELGCRLPKERNLPIRKCIFETYG